MKVSKLFFLCTLLCSMTLSLIAMEREETVPKEEGEVKFETYQPQSTADTPSLLDSHFHPKKSFYKRPMTYVGSAAIVAGAALAAFTALELWQRWQIKNVLNKYGKSFSTLSPEHQYMMVAAYKKNLTNIRGFIDLDVSMIAAVGNEWVIPAMTELYFKERPTQERQRLLRNLIMPQLREPIK